MIHRILLDCWPFWSSGLIGFAGSILGVGASGNEDFPSDVVLAWTGSSLGRETSPSPHRAKSSWDCSSVVGSSCARPHAVAIVPANATAMQNDRIGFKASPSPVFPLAGLIGPTAQAFPANP